jgi:chitinase
MAYYSGTSKVALPAAEIDFSAFTHLAVFALLPTPTGGVDDTTKMRDPAAIQDVLTAAHAAGKKVLVTVGGASSGPLFEAALTKAHRASFVRALAAYVVAKGYDGVDLDMEPISANDEASYTAFVEALRAALPSSSLLTAAAGWDPALFVTLAPAFDRIDVMTYHFIPATPHLAWHNAALYSGGAVEPINGSPLPSCDDDLARFVRAGIAREKLGIGIDFNGEVWTGVTEPGETGATGTTALSYAEIMDDYAEPGLYHWDPIADGPYLSITAGPQAPAFVSYDDEALIAAKASYVRDRGLGSVILWNLQADYRASQPEGARSVLLEAVKRAMTP